MRDIIINTENWNWKCSRSDIIIRSPLNNKYVISLTNFSGLPNDVLEKMCDKKCGFKITPSKIKEYILQNKLI